MVDITTRSAKGSALTHTEVDGNFTNLKNAVEGINAVTVYATVSNLPLSNLTSGDLAYVSGTNRLYLSNGTGWYNIALVNQTPTITGNSATYELATDGTATTVTLTGTDPEGLPITWSATTSGDTNVATVTNNANVFTITPSTNTANGGTLSVTFNASDGINIGTASSSFTLEFVSAEWKFVTLSTGHGSTNGVKNATFIDRSTNTYTITPNGAPTQSAFHPYLDYWSVDFDGSGDNFSVPASADFAFGTGDFTIEFWAYFRTISLYDTLYIHGNTSGTVQLFFSSTTTLRYNNNSVASVLDATNTMPTNEWVHIALVRNSGTATWYINGTASGSGSDSNNWSSSATALTIGRDPVNGRDFDGYLSNLRVVKGTAVYTSNFTAPVANLTAVTNTKLLTCQSNRFIDNSSSGRTLTVGGDPKISAFNPFGQESAYASGANKGSVFFNTTSQWLYAPSSVLGLGAGDFTVESWVYLTQYNSSTSALWDWRSGGGASTNVPATWVDADGNIAWVEDVGSSANITSSSQIKLHTWNHVAVVRNGTTVTMYINGVDNGSYTSSSTFGTARFRVNDSQGSYGLYGYVADTKISIGTAAYTSAFTPPTSSLGNTNASLYLPMDNAQVFDHSGSATLKFGSNAVTSTTYTKFASTSLHCPSNGGYLVTQESMPAMSTSDFTIEVWAYPATAMNNNAGVIGQGWNGGLGSFILYTQTGTNLVFYGSSNNSSWNVANAFDTGIAKWTGSWKHIAICRSGSSIRFFLDGQLQNTLTSAGTLYGVAQPISLGGGTSGSGAMADIYFENFQVLLGTAKYTANFTVPSATQNRSNQATS